MKKQPRPANNSICGLRLHAWTVKPNKRTQQLNGFTRSCVKEKTHISKAVHSDSDILQKRLFYKINTLEISFVSIL